MTYKELYDKALWDLEHDKITLGEFDKMIEPLNKDIPKEEQTDGDLISRQAVLDIFGDMHPLDYNARAYVKQIKELPSAEKTAEVRPMQVELEADGYADGELVYDFGKCPKCGWIFEEGDKDWEEPYCCHCGQKLKWFESEEE